MWDRSFAERIAQIRHESGGDIPEDLAAVIFMCALVGDARHLLLLSTSPKSDIFVSCLRKVIQIVFGVKSLVLPCSPDLSISTALEILCPQSGSSISLYSDSAHLHPQSSSLRQQQQQQHRQQQPPPAKIGDTWHGKYSTVADFAEFLDHRGPELEKAARMTTSKSVSDEMAEMTEPTTSERRASFHEPKQRLVKDDLRSTSLSRARSHGANERKKLKKAARGQDATFEAVILQDLHLASKDLQSVFCELMNHQQVFYAGKTHSVSKAVMVFGVMPEQIFVRREFNLIPKLLPSFFLSKAFSGNPFLPLEVTTPASMITKVDLDDSRKQLEQVFVSLESDCYTKDIVVGIRNHFLLGPCVSPKTAADFGVASRAQAFIEGYDFVAPHHIVDICPHTFQHALIFRSELPFCLPSMRQQSQGVTTAEVINSILTHLAPPV